MVTIDGLKQFGNFFLVDEGGHTIEGWWYDEKDFYDFLDIAMVTQGR